jgi:hypothetical protein
MEPKYKLKKEARQFFDNQKYHTTIQSLESWESSKIPIQLLDEVERCYVAYGHKEQLTKDLTTTSLSSWSQESNAAEFKFSLKVSDITIVQHNKVKIAELMDEMQKVANKFFKEHYLEK